MEKHISKFNSGSDIFVENNGNKSKKTNQNIFADMKSTKSMKYSLKNKQ